MPQAWILFDLDGTLLDVSERYHRLHANLVLRHGGRPLDASSYWQAKRRRVSEAELLGRTGLDSRAVQEALTQRRRWIESRRYLRFDRLWPWTATVLDELAHRAPLALVTLRRHPDRLLQQLGYLGIAGHFEHVVAGPGDGSVEGKALLVREAGLSFPSESVLVGDTEVDIASGHALGLRTVALSCGIRCADDLMAWEPDALLDDLRRVPDYLFTAGWRAS